MMLKLNWYGLAHVPIAQSWPVLTVLVGGNIIKLSISATSKRDLGVLLDSELSLNLHVNKVVSSCYYHIRRQRQVVIVLGRMS